MRVEQNERGFSYLDVLIGISILLVGVLALAAAVTGAVVRSREAEQQLIAKQIADSTLESIFSARDINRFGATGWDAVGNVGSNVVDGVARGVFVVGVQPVMSETGTDGIIGTSDDSGTAMNGFRRQITITDICDPQKPSYNCQPAGENPVMMRRVEVVIFYQVTGREREERAATVITNYD